MSPALHVATDDLRRSLQRVRTVATLGRVVQAGGTLMRTFLAPASPGPIASRDVPGFSVVIAAHQVADLVGAAIESALAQTSPPLEVIV